MKVKLEFDTNDENDFNLHKTYIKAVDMSIALWDITQYLRELVKYPPDNMSDETYETIEKIRDKIWDIIDDCNVKEVIN